MLRVTPSLRNLSWRIGWRLSFVACLVAGSVLGPSSAAQASDPCNNGGYNWMKQWTSTTAGNYHTNGQNCSNYYLYFGWTGIDGAIKIPATVTYLSKPGSQHDVGWLDMSLNDCGASDCTHAQVGFYTAMSMATSNRANGACTVKYTTTHRTPMRETPEVVCNHPPK